MVGALVAALVAVGGADQQQHRAARRDRRAVVLDVLGDVAGDVGPGRLEAERLVDGAGISDRSSTRSRRWSGCSASTLASQPISRPVVSLPAPASTWV